MPSGKHNLSQVTEGPPDGDDGTIAWRSLLAEATDRLASVSERPDIDARRIIETAAGFEPAEFLAGLDQLVTNRAIASYDQMIDRRLQGEPLQYVVGSWSFRYLDLMVDRRVLIPRPETEVVAGLAIAEIDAIGATKVADLGTGSGAIGLSIAHEREVEVWATDFSQEALAVARANLAALGRVATRVTLAEGSWFEALPSELMGQLDVIVSNPPYVGDDEELPSEVADWEPVTALRAGPQGTDDLHVLISQAPEWLSAGGSLVLEMAPWQTSDARDAALAAGFVAAEVFADNTGRDRAVVARKRSEA